MTMSETSLRELIDRGEGEQVEFKTASNGVHDDTFETVCSFGNLGRSVVVSEGR